MNMRKHYRNKKITSNTLNDWLDMEHDTACIDCTVASEQDVLSPYSVKGYEFLNDEFRGFLDKASECIPDDKAVVLYISGCEFSDTQKDRIRKAVYNEYMIEAQKNLKTRKSNYFRILWFAVWFAIVVTVFMGIYNNFGNTIFLDFFFIAIYFVGDRMIDYLVMERGALVKDKIKAVQMMCMDVEFDKEFVDFNLSEEERASVREKVMKNLDKKV